MNRSPSTSSTPLHGVASFFVRSLLLGLLVVGGAGCDARDPGALKAVNIGFPPGARGLGALAVSPEGRPFVLMSSSSSSALWELEGSLEEDTQVWVRRELAVTPQDLLGFVEGVGLIGYAFSGDRPVYLGITDEGATPLARWVDGTPVLPLWVSENGTVLGVSKLAYPQSRLLRLAPGASAWEEIAGTEPSFGMGTVIASAVLHPNGKLYATNGSRIFELPTDLSGATKLFDCDTRELGSCGVSSRLVHGGIRLAGDGTLTIAMANDEVELYSFRPGDRRLTKRAVVRSPINEQSYFGRAQGLVVDRKGNAYVVMRTEQVGGEGHVLAHRPGAAQTEWVTVVTGLPRVLHLQMDQKDGIWLWDSSDSYTGLWKLVPSSTQCPRCGETEP
ncbi:MAG TPA: hypothetical protein VFZ09_29945 [Archangium sp.]|uniref:hypothetical protein n=1 Tax=Archangium sp. TaxID=1872627 RepID=UPI002E30F661|nr:hypothetical protein [Archangium sp.]HEX5750488.1 hypothetical protein [Archangium sp.]